MNWIVMPMLYPHITSWGCAHGPWSYVLSHNSQQNDWAASVRRLDHPENQRIDLGWHFNTRAEAEVAIDEHYRSTLQ